MKVNFVDLKRQNKNLFMEIGSLIDQVILEADFNMGSRLERFENNFAKYVGKKYAVGLNSGTDALFLSLMAYGIGKDDEVILPTNSYFSTAMVVSNLGAKPVFVDVDPIYLHIDPFHIEKAITKKSRAIIPVHLYGQSVDMDPIIKIAKKNKLFVIEDACQAHGAMYKGEKVPVTETGAFSFYPGKNLGAFGDGGAVATDNKKIAMKILHLRNDGAYKKYVHEMFGVKSRLDTIQAAVLDLKLKHLTKWNSLRVKHAALYSELLNEITEINTPSLRKDAYHVFHIYAIQAEKREELQFFLKKHGIDTVIHYPIPIHFQKPYKKLGFKKGDFPVSENNSMRTLSLPMFPEITDKEISYVADTIKSFYRKR